jgi:hypothetical protein
MKESANKQEYKSTESMALGFTNALTVRQTEIYL